MNVDEVLKSVRRELFIPPTIWVPREDGRSIPLNREEDPSLWERLVADDDKAIVIQVDDGTNGHDAGTYPTSSSSTPRVMTTMIDALNLQSGMKVLEIGTGTGYNAAILALIAGATNVTTMEIDPAIADHARKALTEAGHTVTVVTGDGLYGHPPNAPYDRIIATAATHHIPYTWIEQTKPGGLILVPWAPTFHPEWPLTLITVHPDGTAQGRCISPGYFMPLRGQRLPGRVAFDTEDRWARMGKPDLERFGVTITRHGQQIWLDSPDNPVNEPVPE